MARDTFTKFRPDPNEVSCWPTCLMRQSPSTTINQLYAVKLNWKVLAVLAAGFCAITAVVSAGCIWNLLVSSDRAPPVQVWSTWSLQHLAEAWKISLEDLLWDPSNTDLLVRTPSPVAVPGSAAQVCVRSSALHPGSSAAAWLQAFQRIAGDDATSSMHMHGAILRHHRQPGGGPSPHGLLQLQRHVTVPQLEETLAAQQCEVVIDMEPNLPPVPTHPGTVPPPSLLLLLEEGQWGGAQGGVQHMLRKHDAVICPNAGCRQAICAAANATNTTMAVITPLLAPLPALAHRAVEWNLAGRPPLIQGGGGDTEVEEEQRRVLPEIVALRHLLGLPLRDFIVGVVGGEGGVLSALAEGLPTGWSAAAMGQCGTSAPGGASGRRLLRVGAVPLDLLMVAVDVAVLPAGTPDTQALMAVWQAGVPVIANAAGLAEVYPDAVLPLPRELVDAAAWAGLLQQAVRPGAAAGAATEARAVIYDAPHAWTLVSNMVDDARACKGGAGGFRVPQLVLQQAGGMFGGAGAGKLEQHGRQSRLLCAKGGASCTALLTASLLPPQCVPSIDITGVHFRLQISHHGQPGAACDVRVGLPGRELRRVHVPLGGAVTVFVLSGSQVGLPSDLDEVVLQAGAAGAGRSTVHANQVLVQVSSGCQVDVAGGEWGVEQRSPP